MIKQILARTDALARLRDPEQDPPIAIISDAGMQKIEAFVATRAARPEEQRIDAWYHAAEDAANGRGDPAVAVSIEMPSLVSASGRPELLELQPEDFCWIAPAP